MKKPLIERFQKLAGINEQIASEYTFKPNNEVAQEMADETDVESLNLELFQLLKNMAKEGEKSPTSAVEELASDMLTIFKAIALRDEADSSR